MKKAFQICGILLLLLLPVLASQAQKADPPVYLTAGIGAGFGTSFGAAVHCLVARQHEVSVGYGRFARRAADMPSDYGNNYLVSDLRLSPYPQDYCSGLAIRYSYVLYDPARPKLVRYQFRGGVLIGKQSTATNFVLASSGWFSTSYNYERVKTASVGLMLQPTVEFTPGRVFGVYLGPQLLVAKDYYMAGLSAGLLLGEISHPAMRR